MGSANVAEDICKVLAQTLGRSVTSRITKPAAGKPSKRTIATAFEESDGTVVSICACDLAFAAFAGAALVILPPQTAKEAVLKGECPPELLENLAEIFSIWRQCFQKPGHHIAPPRVYGDVSEAPASIGAALGSARQRLDLEVTISGYGSGQLSIVMSDRVSN